MELLGVSNLQELKQFKILLPVLPILILIMCLIMLIGAGTGDSSEIIVNYFSVPFAPEVNYIITSYFGERDDPIDGTRAFHAAIDLAAPKGTDILATADGTVVAAHFESATGWIVLLEHKFDGIKYQTFYAHMFKDSIVVNVGDYVLQGQKIGIIGNTGSRTTGTHLHFAIYSPDRSGGKKNSIDPIKIFKN